MANTVYVSMYIDEVIALGILGLKSLTANTSYSPDVNARSTTMS